MYYYYLRNMETKALESIVTHEFLGGIGDLLATADGSIYLVEDFECVDKPENF